MEQKCLLLYAFTTVMQFVTYASYFRGGTISWKPTGNGTEVLFSFKLRWTYGNGPGCDQSRIGQLVTGMNTSYWQCTGGCNGTLNLTNVNYICIGANRTENWEEGENTFIHTFPGIGPFVVEFTQDDWLKNSSIGGWSIGTMVYLANRSDTHLFNRSPITTAKHLYTVQYGCRTTIRIPVMDDDGDTVRCRWSTGSGCGSVCTDLPLATLDSNTCTLSFPANETPNEMYAVKVSVEDFPKLNIKFGSKVYTPKHSLSTVNLLFLVKTISVPGKCSDRPRFTVLTPAQGSTVHTDVMRNFQLSFYITDKRGITKVDISAPSGMTYTSPQTVPSTPGSVFVTTTWIPQRSQVGTHVVCALAENILGCESLYKRALSTQWNVCSKWNDSKLHLPVSLWIHRSSL
uniref:Integrin beta-like protein A isoform X2 n=1 Tax=Crassostrea virginica TaxID=6565 RepID=A0A8B8BFZ4_CRAVI|nr:integrin beta-like protein A isoform X2 [Crassostrea virginica]